MRGVDELRVGSEAPQVLTQHVQLRLGVPGGVRREGVDEAAVRLPSWTSQLQWPD